MEHNQEEIISVKAVLDYECKRFDISATDTFSHFVDTLSDIFLCEISNIQYKDRENDLISMGSEEEFSVALKCVPETGGILRVVLSANVPQKVDETTPCQESSASENVLMETNSSCQILNDTECDKELEVAEYTENNSTDKDTKSTSSESRKSSIRHKIESASKLSKDLNFVSSEVTGRIPVLAPSSECNLDTHFSTQKPGARKVRRVSSGTVSTGTDKSDKKQGRGRQSQRKKKRKHRDSSSSSSDSSSSGSSSSSSSSSSESSCEDDYCYYKKGRKKKRQSSPSRNIDKILHKCEKRITRKVAKDVDKYTKSFKEDVLNSVTSAIMQKLEGAVVQSFVVPNVPDVGVLPSSPKVVDGFAKRLRYQHQNVVCDHCELEIFGPRYKCGNCSDYDLCEQCEAIEGLHTPSHVFIKMHYPSVHAGRRSIGGRSRPLLRANIYEEREKEREMEDLLQRKLDSGSELNAKVMETFEKRRSKMREAEQSREAYDNRKEEWKKMKKEIKKNKKELARKSKHQGKSLQRNVGIVTSKKDDTLLCKEGFCFDVESLPKTEQKIVKHADFTEQTSIKQDSKTQDEKLSSAISGLQIVQEISPNGVQQIANQETNLTNYDEVIIDIPTDSLSDSDRVESDVVVVDSEEIPMDSELIALCPGVETLPKPDLVDFNREVAESTTSEDFIVVSNYFDLSVPIDNKHILEHRNCDSCHSDHFAPELIQPQYSDACTSTANELPVDLVASVPIITRNQSDIASVSTVNIMDQSIECFSIASSPLISPEPLTCIQLSEPFHEVNSLQSTGEINESTIPPVDEILNEPSQSEVSLCHSSGKTSDEAINQISLHEEIASSDGPNIFSEQTSDETNPIIQSQLEREEMIRSNEFSSCQSEISNSIDNINTPAPCELQEHTHTEPTLPYEESHVDPKAEGMRQLLEMGFFDRPLNDRLLETYKNDVGRCVAELLVENDNQWHQTRH